MEVRVELRRDGGRVEPNTGPWIRRRQIARIHGSPDPHALACVFDRRGDVVAWGLISAVSTITVRVLSFGPDRPPDDWLERRIDGAVAARRAYRLDEEGTTGYREVNSEGDGLPGLVVDRYADDLVVQITTAPMAARREPIVARLREHFPGRIHVLMPEGPARREGFVPGMHRDPASPADLSRLSFLEHGLSFEVPAPPAQKTGAYFDQRGNRRIVAHLAHRHGGPLLDVGCHVGGFALHAGKLGVSAVALDQSATALEYAEANARANGLDECTFVRADMFDAWQDPALRGPFGTIVLDPPKIAARKGDVDRAVGALRRLAGNAATRLDDGGHFVLCSCSHHLGRDHLDKIVAALPHAFTRVGTLGAGFDHPVMPAHREGEYLRVGVYQRRG